MALVKHLNYEEYGDSKLLCAHVTSTSLYKSISALTISHFRFTSN